MKTLKTSIKTLGEKIIKALAISALKWLANMIIKSTILTVLPFLAPLIVIWDIIKW